MASPDEMKPMVPHVSQLSAGQWNIMIELLKRFARDKPAFGASDSSGAYASRGPVARRRKFLAKITDTDGTGYGFQEVLRNADRSTLDVGGGATGTTVGTPVTPAYPLRGGEVGVGDVVEMTEDVYFDNQTRAYWFDASRAFFPVLVKSNGGADGTSTAYATWAYDLYDLADTVYAENLNLSGALQPMNSAARVVKASVTKAADGSVGEAFYDASGAIQLYNCIELGPQTNCS